MAFFKLLALNMSCSRGRNIWGLAVHDEPTDRSLEESQALPDPSPSSVSSAMVGGGFGRDEDAWDSSFSVFSNESSFSFKTEHYKMKNIWVELTVDCVAHSFSACWTAAVLILWKQSSFSTSEVETQIIFPILPSWPWPLIPLSFPLPFHRLSLLEPQNPSLSHKAP